MLQSDGEPAWQGKTYNASKDKKHLTGINKEEVVGTEQNSPLQLDFDEYTYKASENSILGVDDFRLLKRTTSYHFLNLSTFAEISLILAFQHSNSLLD
jgi:hypothetical protein